MRFFLFCWVVLLPALAFVSSMQGCRAARTEKTQKINYTDSLLFGTWYRSFEEEGAEQGRLKVWRNAATFKFPPSRGREGMTFLTQGRFTLISIAPTDGFEEQQGTWGYNGQDNLDIILENGRRLNLKIKSLKGNQMMGYLDYQ